MRGSGLKNQNSMKAIRFISIVFALVLAACSRTDDSMDIAGGYAITSLDGFIEERADSRTLAEVREDGSVQMYWRAGDEIAVTDLSALSTFKLKSGAKSTHGVFAGSIVSTSKTMYAVYPASVATITEGTASVTLPNIQSYTSSADADTGGRNIMVGETADASAFDFYTVGAIARFAITVDADETINSLTMRVEDGYLSGLGTIDLQSRTLSALNKRNVTLNYTEPAIGSSTDGWALIAPIDFTSTTGKVYYDITTSKGKYTFCRKPTKAFRAGMVYNFPLNKNNFEQVASSSELADGKYTFESNASTLTVKLLRATDTTIAVGWSQNGFPADYSADIADEYEFYLYNERNQSLVIWRPNTAQCVTGNAVFAYTETSATNPPRFIFTGLTPNTTYKVKVKNLTTAKSSAMLIVSTAAVDCDEVVSTAQNEGDIIAFQNFGKLVWNGDMTTLSAGYIYPGYASLTDIDDGTAWGDYRSEEQTTYKYTRQDREQQLFTTYKAVVQSCGLGDWAYWRNSADDAQTATPCAILSRPGYVKVGVSKVRAGMATPVLSALRGKATVRVSFKACAYGTTTPDQTALGVRAIDGGTLSSYRLTGGTEGTAKSLTISDKFEWNKYSVEVSGVSPTSRIVVFANAADVSSKNNRFHLDDIKVEFVRYEEAVEEAPVVKQVAADVRNVTVEWNETNTDGTRKYTVAIYKDAACTNKYQEYATTISSSTNYMAWPARFTFPHLTPKTTYYVTVTDSAGKVSSPAAVTTSAERTSVSNEVLYAGFDELCFGGDYINMANAPVLSGTASSFKPSELTEAIAQSVSSSAPTTDGGQFTSHSSETLQLLGLDAWTGVAALVRQGFVKVGTASAKGSITTPDLGCITSGAALKVSFKACPFVDGKTDQTSHINVKLIAEDGTVKATQSVEIGGRRSQPGWDSFTIDFTGAEPVDKLQFEAGDVLQSRFCIDDILVTSPSAITGKIVFGYVKDSDGNPMADVVVSDGFSAAKTNASGYYRLTPTSDTWYIYYSIPEDCEVPINSYGQPAFFTKYSSSKSRYDFTLKRMSGGVETAFNLFCLADPQCRSTDISRFTNETVADIKSHAATKSLPCYGVTLGDIGYSETSRNTVPYMSQMRSAMAKSKIGMPIFQTIGNHDYTYFYGSSNPISADATSSTANLKCQRAFENVFGPINYSWNRGDVHIVSMRNIIYNSTTDASNYSMGFTDEQYKWLQQDLAYTPKTKMIILCVHIPIMNSSKLNVQNVLKLIKQFKTAHIMSGHTHYMRNEPTKSGAYEHVHAAVCGAWWWSSVNGDGSPNGYAVYEINGTTMTDWYYKGVNNGMNKRSYQIRLYRGNIKTGGSYEYFKYQLGSNVLLANVFNADSSWTVKVYENGVYSGDMTPISYVRYDATTLPKSSTSPTYVPTDSSQDFWAIGYHIGVVGRGHTDSYMTSCFHMYKYTLKNSSATIKVVATDRFGNEYTQTSITGDCEYTYAKKP